MTGNATNLDDHFRAVFTDNAFHEALALVSETVDYQEGDGVLDRDAMNPVMRAVFATESMRLTTRLMQIVSWFLVQRAVQNGELTEAEAIDPSRRLGSIDLCLGEASGGSAELPGKMRDLLARSRNFFEQIVRVEAMMTNQEAKSVNPVQDLLDRLE
jgi:regulator of CtrA degradation